MRLSALIPLCCLPLAAQTNPPQLCTVEGTVTNAATGAPVRKASVLMIRTDSPQTYSASTDIAGKFALKDIAPGKYRMQLMRDGFVPASYGARSATQPGKILVLETGQNLEGIDVHLAPYGVVTGRIVDEDGQPITYASVGLVPLQTWQAKQQQVNRVAGVWASTNDLGEYRIFGVAPGKYYVRAVSSHTQPQPDYAPTYFPGTIDRANASVIEVASGATVGGTDFTLSTVKTVHVKGTVSNIPAGGEQRSIQVLLESKTFGLRPVFTDTEGKFDLAGVVPGEYDMAALLSEGERNLSASVPLHVGSVDVENVSLALAPGADITGSVRIEGDKSPDLSKIYINLPPRDPSRSFFGFQRAFLKEDNSFQFRSIPPSLFDLAFFGLPDGFYVKSIRSGAQDVLANGLDLSQGAPQPLDVLLSPNAATLTGTVQNPNTGQPVEGATVVLVPPERDRRLNYRSTTAGPNGRYTLKNLTPGEYKAFAWEDIEPDAYLDPDYLKPVESKGQAIILRENDRQTITLTAIPADSSSVTSPQQ